METGKTKPSKIAGGLLTLVLVAIGVTRGNTDQTLVKYHNEFVQKAYSAVVRNGWDPFVQKVRADDATMQSTAAYVKESLVPPIEKWAKEAEEMRPPEFAAEFHNNFSAQLRKAAAETKKLLASLESEDTDAMTASLKKMTPIFQQIDQTVAEFQKKLKDERDFTFEEKK